MYQKNFKHLPSSKSIEVVGPKIGGFDAQKSPFSGVFFFAVFSGTVMN